MTKVRPRLTQGKAEWGAFAGDEERGQDHAGAVASIKRLCDGARRIEDRYGTGILDLIIKLPDRPFILAEAKLINGNLFAPTGAQYEEGKKWEAAGVNCLLLGWKGGQLHISHWVEKADYRECFTLQGFPDIGILMEYLL